MIADTHRAKAGHDRDVHDREAGYENAWSTPYQWQVLRSSAIASSIPVIVNFTVRGGDATGVNSTSRFAWPIIFFRIGIELLMNASVPSAFVYPKFDIGASLSIRNLRGVPLLYA